jgi:hypothetical protein
VHVSAVAGLIRQRLGGEASPQAAPDCRGPDGFPQQDVVVGGAQRRRMPDRNLMLAVTELGIIVLDL